jgi:hypothetical protein
MLMQVTEQSNSLIICRGIRPWTQDGYDEVSVLTCQGTRIRLGCG